MDIDQTISRLEKILRSHGRKVIACSGGIDSLLLATVAYRNAPGETLIAHASSPAVPADASKRVQEFSSREGWDTHYVATGEFDDPAYFSNPVNRCFYCKDKLYSTLAALRKSIEGSGWQDAVVMSGANTDDLDDYRPGMEAAANHGVSHPFIESGINKAQIRAISRHLDLPIADLPASPCLSSRVYTGTKVTPERVRAIDSAESAIRRTAQVDVVRCRVRENEMLIEVLEDDRIKIDAGIIEHARQAAQSVDDSIEEVNLYAEAYQTGRAFQGPK
jgi:uncharacterized protein